MHHVIHEFYLAHRDMCITREIKKSIGAKLVLCSVNYDLGVGSDPAEQSLERTCSHPSDTSSLQ